MWLITEQKPACPRVMGRSLPMGGPGRLPPRVRDENALLYMSFHLPCNLSRPTEISTSPPAASSSLAAPSAFRRSSSLAARPLFSPETALCTYSMLNSSIRNITITKITIIRCRKRAPLTSRLSFREEMESEVSPA